MKIPFWVGWTSINPSYFDVNRRGTTWVLTHCHLMANLLVIWWRCLMCLVDGLEHLDSFPFHIYSDMGCHHPSHWRTPSFFKMIIAPPTRFFWCWFWFCSRICLVISWWFDLLSDFVWWFDWESLFNDEDWHWSYEELLYMALPKSVVNLGFQGWTFRTIFLAQLNSGCTW